MTATPEFVTGFRYKHFIVDRARQIPEMRCQLIELHHEPSQAKILYIAAPDPENLFCLSFQTLPSSSDGVAHVLEHLTLCGSRKFPVKDPFFSMTRRSMNTFMNALTGNDFTCYPAASQIEQDFYNLLDVYLDAVFHPLLDPLSFLQEGHRLEFQDPTNPSSPLIINGVVYNEMKGSFTKPMRRLMKQMCSALFPDLPYGFDSGGDPGDIPSLTLEKIKQFHSTYYHPSRCCFFFYGNLPLQKHLDFLEEHALSNCAPLPAEPVDLHQPRFHTPHKEVCFYPATEDETQKSYIAFGWLTTQIANQLECLALTVLESAILDTDASFLTIRLLQSGKCKQVLSSCDCEIAEVPFIIALTGCEAEDAEALTSVLFAGLEEIAEKGLPNDLIESALHQLELSKCEITGNGSPFGLSMYSRSALLVHHGVDPIKGLEIHSLFETLRQSIADDPLFFQKLVQKYFLFNRHFARIVLAPSMTLEKEEQAQEEKRLAEIKDKLTPEKCSSLIQQTINLEAFQEKESDLSCLPSLTIHDVPTSCRHIPLQHTLLGNVDLFSHETFTNDIVYLDLISPLPFVPAEDVWLLRLFTVLLPQLGCGNRSYEQTLEYIHAHTGGVASSLNLNVQASNPDIYTPSWRITGKALARNTSQLCAILSDYALEPCFDDRRRIHEILEKHHTELENSLYSNALEYAFSITNAPLSEALALSEQWYGLSYLRRLRQLVFNYADQEEAFLNSLKRLKDAFVKRQYVHILACADGLNIQKAMDNSFWGLLDLPLAPAHSWNTHCPIPESCNLGFVIPSNVSYVGMTHKTVPYIHRAAPVLAVVAELCNNTFLHKKLREQGGAYGGGASYTSMSGAFSFYSYKDPNLFTTVQHFGAALKFLLQGNFTDVEIDEAKLSVLQDMDTPIAPGSRADVAYAWWQQGRSEGVRQSYRDRLIHTSRSDILAAIEHHLSGTSAHFTAFANQAIFNRDLPLFEKAGTRLPLTVV